MKLKWIRKGFFAREWLLVDLHNGHILETVWKWYGQWFGANSNKFMTRQQAMADCERIHGRPQ